MGNPLDGFGTSPPAPRPEADGNALQQGAPAQAQQAPAPPDHAMTVAALRHFDAIKGELSVILNNPSLGKSDLKSAFIDGTSKLVADRILSPAQAVIQLSQVPEDPLAQRKWATQMMQQTVQSERTILAHHAMGFAGQGPQPTPSADNHMDVMSALHSNYSGSK